jgi:hypothetical protein
LELSLGFTSLDLAGEKAKVAGRHQREAVLAQASRAAVALSVATGPGHLGDTVLGHDLHLQIIDNHEQAGLRAATRGAD